MKSIKPGRAPSFMGGAASLIIGAIGVGWTIMAIQIGAPGFFTFFGVCFVLIAVGSAIYQFVNATRKNRFSAFDITDGHEEPDPLNVRFGARAETPPSGDGTTFCPFCGTKAEEDFIFCKKCGQKLPT